MLAYIIPPRMLEPDWTQPLWLCVVLMAIGLATYIFYVFIDKRFDDQLVVAGGVDEEEDEPFRIGDIGKLITDPSFLYIVLLCVTFYSAVFPFMKYAPDLLVNKWGMSQTMASDITSILPFGTILFTPLFGWIIDFKGKGATLMIFGSVILVITHLMFALTTVTPWVPMFPARHRLLPDPGGHVAGPGQDRGRQPHRHRLRAHLLRSRTSAWPCSRSSSASCSTARTPASATPSRPAPGWPT